MKKLLALLLALTILLGFAGCADVGIIGGEDGDTYIYIGDSEYVLDDEMYEDPDAYAQETESDPMVWDSEEVTDAPEREPETEAETEPETEPEALISEDGWYYSAEEVALYIHTYGHLPENFITKAEARELGWEGGSVEVYAPGCAIGGDKFGNREGLLPKAPGRQYYECDIDTNGSNSRGAKRIVFSNDGLIYYTDDHYETFTLLYGEEDT